MGLARLVRSDRTASDARATEGRRTQLSCATTPVKKIWPGQRARQAPANSRTHSGSYATPDQEREKREESAGNGGGDAGDGAGIAGENPKDDGEDQGEAGIEELPEPAGDDESVVAKILTEERPGKRSRRRGWWGIEGRKQGGE